ncbi:NmrA family NAD(P)-binding protein [Planctobacterium marinum]|uniref:NmrA family NAD(P)-binding protein n=1 Tax=Planctobacterium marinum TaxID=1631968 RepID=UPI0030C7790A
MEHKIALITAPKSKTGRRVVELLQRSEYLVRIASRSTRIKFDWEDENTWQQAITGVDSAYIIIPPNLALSNMSAKLSRFIELCEKNSMRRIVLLTGRGEAESRKCETVVLKSDIPATIVRTSWFSQNFSEGVFLDSILNGEIVVPVNGVKEPFIDASDIAEVVYHSLLDESPDNHIYEITGPELLSFKKIAEIFSNNLKVDVTATHIPLDTYLSELAKFGIAEEEIKLTRYLFEELLDGRNEYLTSDLERVLGREPTSFQQYIESTRRSGAWELLSIEETNNGY